MSWILRFLVLSLLTNTLLVAKSQGELNQTGADAAITCDYKETFRSTVKALGGDHFQKLLKGNHAATKIVGDWYNASIVIPKSAKDDELAGNLDALNKELQAYNYTFRELVEKRLNDSLKNDAVKVNDAINVLFNWGFAFPLFDQNPKYGSANFRLSIADQFSKGRFCVHSWANLYTKYDYDPGDYENSDIEFFIGIAQAHGLIPIIDSSIWGCPPGTLGVASSDTCCCNGGTTHAAYRTCIPGTGYNCTGAPKCALASQNCPTHNSP